MDVLWGDVRVLTQLDMVDCRLLRGFWGTVSESFANLWCPLSKNKMSLGVKHGGIKFLWSADIGSGSAYHRYCSEMVKWWKL